MNALTDTKYINKKSHAHMICTPYLAIIIQQPYSYISTVHVAVNSAKVCHCYLCMDDCWTNISMLWSAHHCVALVVYYILCQAVHSLNHPYTNWISFFMDEILV